MYNLCCISNELKDQGVKFQTMTWKRFNQLSDEHGVEYALEELGARWLNNVEVTHHHIEFCHNNGWGYRVSSSLFPILTHPDFKYGVADVPQFEAIVDEFKTIVFNNEVWQVRLSTHPSQFVVLASENQNAVKKSIVDLNHHGWVMDMLGCQQSYYNPINIHVNCTKGELSDIAARFMSNLNKCDQSVTSRLVVENEDKGCWTVANLLRYFYKDYLIPITYDNLHHKCNPCVWDLDNTWHTTSEEVALSPMELCAKTWGMTKPLFHYSESHPEKTNPRSQADMPTDRPCSDQYDWDIELKSKDAAIRACAAIELTQQAQELDMGY